MFRQPRRRTGRRPSWTRKSRSASSRSTCPPTRTTAPRLPAQTTRASAETRFGSATIRNASTAIDPASVPDLPTFTSESEDSRHLATVSYFRTLSPDWFNETRLAYTRSANSLPAGDFEFPGLDSFPNISIEQDLDIQIGPYLGSPQSGVQNTYQIVNNLTWVRGRHTLKLGADARRNITSELFVQRQRGDYNYSTLERFLLDPQSRYPGRAQYRRRGLPREQHRVLLVLQQRDEGPTELDTDPRPPPRVQGNTLRGHAAAS